MSAFDDFLTDCINDSVNASMTSHPSRDAVIPCPRCGSTAVVFTDEWRPPVCAPCSQTDDRIRLLVDQAEAALVELRRIAVTRMTDDLRRWSLVLRYQAERLVCDAVDAS